MSLTSAYNLELHTKSIITNKCDISKVFFKCYYFGAALIDCKISVKKMSFHTNIIITKMYVALMPDTK